MAILLLHIINGMISIKKGQDMEFLDRFSLEDVVIVFIGLLLVSIVRIWYDSYVTNKKANQFGNSLGIYNSLLDDTREGLLIVSDDNYVIYSNNEAANILNARGNEIGAAYLSTVIIENSDRTRKDKLLDIMQTHTHIPNAYIMHLSDSMPISISINKIKPYSHANDIWYVIILQNMTNMNELRDGAENLLAV